MIKVGFVLAAAPGDVVSEGDLIGTVHAADNRNADLGAHILEGAVTIVPGGTARLRPLVSHRVHVDGVDVVTEAVPQV